MNNDTITAIRGIRVGHAVLPGAPSGCTVILPEGGAVAAVDIRGGAPGTFGTDALNPLYLVDRLHGLFLTGGSAFGLGVAEGVKCYLMDRRAGFETPAGPVPIIAGAVLYDLPMIPQGERMPDPALGYEACLAASDAPVPEGSTGAGTGATVGKLHGLDRCMRGGLGSSLVCGPGGIEVGAIVAVNAYGDVVDPATDIIQAGCRKGPDSLELLDMDQEILRLGAESPYARGTNTVVGAVATNVRYNKTQLTRIAQMAHDGLARTVYPAHTQYDGDTVFALSTEAVDPVELSVIGTLAARALAEAILRAVRKAESLKDIPAFRSLPPGRPRSSL